MLIKAAHMQALRDQANIARTALGFANSTFPEPITANSTGIKAVHLTQLQDALR